MPSITRNKQEKHRNRANSLLQEKNNCFGDLLHYCKVACCLLLPYVTSLTRWKGWWTGNSYITCQMCLYTVFPFNINMSSKNYSVLLSVDCLRKKNIISVFLSCNVVFRSASPTHNILYLWICFFAPNITCLPYTVHSPYNIHCNVTSLSWEGTTLAMTLLPIRTPTALNSTLAST